MSSSRFSSATLVLASAGSHFSSAPGGSCWTWRWSQTRTSLAHSRSAWQAGSMVTSASESASKAAAAATWRLPLPSTVTHYLNWHTGGFSPATRRTPWRIDSEKIFHNLKFLAAYKQSGSNLDSCLSLAGSAAASHRQLRPLAAWVALAACQPQCQCQWLGLAAGRLGASAEWSTDHHLDSCRRTMSYVRRTTSYNTDVAHDVVSGARTTSYPYDVVHGARTTSYIDVVRQTRTTRTL